MQKFLVGTFLVALTGASAMAADMPVRGRGVAPPPPPAPTRNWSGCYFGGEAGYLTRRAQTTVVDGNTVFSAGSVLDPSDADGLLAGGVVGCNWQWGMWVLGAEASWDWADVHGNNSNIGDVNTLRVANSHSSIDSFATATGRLGYLWHPNVLVYAKGGVAWLNVDLVSNTNNLTGSALFSTSHSSFRSDGWLAGGGVELALFDNVTFKAEYNYIDLGTTAYSAVTVFNTNSSLIGNSAARSLVSTAHVGKIGINYKLWGWGG